jgi:hypothetical protein
MFGGHLHDFGFKNECYRPSSSCSVTWATAVLLVDILKVIQGEFIQKYFCCLLTIFKSSLEIYFFKSLPVCKIGLSSHACVPYIY